MWVARLGGICVASALSSAFMLMITPKSWWQLSGLPENPGDFVRKNEVSYPACAAWTEVKDGSTRSLMQDDLLSSAVHVTKAQSGEVIDGDSKVNVGVLLPRNAAVLKIYCGSAPPAQVPQECSGERCNPPLSAEVSDSLYTRGRAVVFTFSRSPNAGGSAPTRGYLWVLWRNEGQQ